MHEGCPRFTAEFRGPNGEPIHHDLAMLQRIISEHEFVRQRIGGTLPENAQRELDQYNSGLRAIEAERDRYEREHPGQAGCGVAVSELEPDRRTPMASRFPTPVA